MRRIVFLWAQAGYHRQIDELPGVTWRPEPTPADLAICEGSTAVDLGVHWSQQREGVCGDQQNNAGCAIEAVVCAVEGKPCPYPAYRWHHEWARTHNIKKVSLISGASLAPIYHREFGDRLRSRQVEFQFFPWNKYKQQVLSEVNRTFVAPSVDLSVDLIGPYHDALQALRQGNRGKAIAATRELSARLRATGNAAIADLLIEASDLVGVLRSTVVMDALNLGREPSLAVGGGAEFVLDRLPPAGLELHLVDDEALTPELFEVFEKVGWQLKWDATADAAMRRLRVNPLPVVICDVYLDATGSTAAAESVLAQARNTSGVVLTVAWSVAASTLPIGSVDARVSDPAGKSVPGVFRLCHEISRVLAGVARAGR